MNNKTKDFESLKKKIEDKKSEVDQAKGAFTSIKKDLQKEYGVGSVKEAKALLKKKEKEIKELEERYTSEATKFEEEFGDDLGL